MRIARIFKAYAQWTSIKESEEDEDISEENVSILGEKLHSWIMRISLSVILVLVISLAFTDPASNIALEQARSFTLGTMTSRYNVSKMWQNEDFNTTFESYLQATKLAKNPLIRLRFFDENDASFDYKDATKYDIGYEMRDVEAQKVCCCNASIASCSELACDPRGNFCFKPDGTLSQYISSEATYDHRDDERSTASFDILMTIIIIVLLFVR